MDEVNRNESVKKKITETDRAETNSRNVTAAPVSCGRDGGAWNVVMLSEIVVRDLRLVPEMAICLSNRQCVCVNGEEWVLVWYTQTELWEEGGWPGVVGYWENDIWRWEYVWGLKTFSFFSTYLIMAFYQHFSNLTNGVNITRGSLLTCVTFGHMIQISVIYWTTSEF